MQQIIVIILIALAVGYLLYTLLGRRRKHHCACHDTADPTKCDHTTQHAGCEGCPLHDQCNQ